MHAVQTWRGVDLYEYERILTSLPMRAVIIAVRLVAGSARKKSLTISIRDPFVQFWEFSRFSEHIMKIDRFGLLGVSRFFFVFIPYPRMRRWTRFLHILECSALSFVLRTQLVTAAPKSQRAEFPDLLQCSQHGILPCLPFLMRVVWQSPYHLEAKLRDKENSLSFIAERRAAHTTTNRKMTKRMVSINVWMKENFQWGKDL